MSKDCDQIVLNLLEKVTDLDDFLNEHRMYGWLYSKRQLLSMYPSDLLGRVDWKQAETQYRFQYHRNLIFKEVVERIINASSSELRERIYLLKGIALMERLYKELPQRWMSDIDLLFTGSEAEAYELEMVLSSEGFRKLATKKWIGDDFKNVWSAMIEGQEIVIEIHSRLFFHVQIDHFVSSIHPKFDLKHLSIEHEFVHLVGHYIFQHNFLKFYWFLDCLNHFLTYREIYHPEILRNMIRKYKLEKSFRMFTYVLKEILGIEDIGPLSEFSRGAWMYQKVINLDTILSGRQGGSKYYFLKHLSKDSMLTAFKYDWHWLKNRSQ